MENYTLELPQETESIIFAKVLREPSNSKDKWITFMAMLLESWQTQSYFALHGGVKAEEMEKFMGAYPLKFQRLR
jgi:hypothetical protein